MAVNKSSKGGDEVNSYKSLRLVATLVREHGQGAVSFLPQDSCGTHREVCRVICPGFKAGCMVKPQVVQILI